MEKKLKVKSQCTGGPKCALGLSKHPKADKKFALGCGICRSTKMEILERNENGNGGLNVEVRADMMTKHGNTNNEQELAQFMGAAAANQPAGGMMRGMKGKKGKKGPGAVARRAEGQVAQEEEYKFQQAENF